ncbi:hypothetical protein BDZ89DRAFT_1040264 [Hymenopellis radicata]|nr:hypothetical protein BDZ89DRAFT_1040264 [Hymenopellis radicata]
MDIRAHLSQTVTRAAIRIVQIRSRFSDPIHGSDSTYVGQPPPTRPQELAALYLRINDCQPPPSDGHLNKIFQYICSMPVMPISSRRDWWRQSGIPGHGRVTTRRIEDSHLFKNYDVVSRPSSPPFIHAFLLASLYLRPGALVWIVLVLQSEQNYLFFICPSRFSNITFGQDGWRRGGTLGHEGRYGNCLVHHCLTDIREQSYACVPDQHYEEFPFDDNATSIMSLSEYEGSSFFCNFIAERAHPFKSPNGRARLRQPCQVSLEDRTTLGLGYLQESNDHYTSIFPYSLRRLDNGASPYGSHIDGRYYRLYPFVA